MASSSCPVVIEDASALTAGFLQAVLGVPTISSFTTTPIGTGQVGQVYRVHLEYPDPNAEACQDQGHAPPSSVILKIASKDPRSRSSGLSLGIYEKETRFYRELAPSVLAASQVITKCYHSAFDTSTGAFSLVLEDAGADVLAQAGDDLEGASLAQARLAMRELGGLHVALMTAATAGEAASWLMPSSEGGSPISPALLRHLCAGFERRYRDRARPEHLDVCARLAASFAGYVALLSTPGACEIGVVHGDYRLDNMLFLGHGGGGDGGGGGLKVVDWQLVNLAPAMQDAAYFFGSSLRVEDRRAWMDELLQVYCDAMASAAGETVLTLEKCRQDLRLQAFTGVIMAMVSSMMVGQTERGDDMFMAMLERSCELVKDLDALALLPPPTQADADDAPWEPEPEDERPHRAGPERDWNESWYFDFVDASQGVAGWVRLGLTPNQQANWYHAAVTRSGHPTVIVSDFHAPAPEHDLRLTTADFAATHELLEPLQKFRVTLQGSGQAFADAADSVRGGQGAPTAIELDLVHETDGVPYKYRLTPRYEIACKVSGSVRIGDGAPIALNGVPGQRDHSFGVRDWWGMDWMWSAFHFEDGQHVHATDLRLFHAPSIAIGYVQRGGLSDEISSLRSEERVGEDRLTDGMAVAISARGVEQDLVVDVRPRAHTPMKLVSADGRVSVFDRAWGEVALPDGTKGVGWFEWNRNEK